MKRNEKKSCKKCEHFRALYIPIKPKHRLEHCVGQCRKSGDVFSFTVAEDPICRKGGAP